MIDLSACIGQYRRLVEFKANLQGVVAFLVKAIAAASSVLV